jgi:cyclic pyranopterin phosphate synthase
MVVKRGTNEQEILPMARYFRAHHGAVLRFIEYMDVGATNGWRMDEVLPSADVVARMPRRIPAGAARPHARRNRPALGLCRRRRRDRRDQQRDPGLLPRLQPRAPVDRGQAVPVPVRQRRPRPARAAARRPSDDDIASAIGHIWQGRADRYSELRALRGPDDDAARRTRRRAASR